MYSDPILDQIMSKLTEDEWDYLKGHMDDNPGGLLISMEGDKKFQTETEKQIEQIGAKVRRTRKSNHEKFMAAFKKFCEDNNLNMQIAEAWAKKVMEITEENSGLQKYCLKQGPMTSIPIHYGITTAKAKETFMNEDGGVSTDMETLLHIEKNVQVEQARRDFVKEYDAWSKKRRDMISEFRMNWKRP